MRKYVLVLVLAAAALWAAPGAFAAGWCGSGESSTDLPDATTGPQVHAIWAMPADAPDAFATGAPKVADDLASITSWWAGQDPTRVPRIDQAAFPAGVCADISFVRLPMPAAAYSGADTAFDLVANELQTSGFGNVYKRYLVYFDGPSVETNVCGTGGGQFDVGPAYAVVWLAGCPVVPTDAVAAHELLHALGALPAGAPHACPGDDAHPCDSAQDILYPYSSGAPLSQLVLDYGHDDYYGHDGSWLDIQDSLWLHLLNAPSFPVSITLAGAGTVASDLPGIVCTVACTTQWDGGTEVELAATPSATTRFVRWTGACSGRSSCALTVSAPTSVTAVFGPLRVPMSIRLRGRGTVRCTPSCGSSFAAGKALVLLAVPAKGWRFVSWSGDCAGRRTRTCRPATDYHVATVVTFARLRKR